MITTFYPPFNFGGDGIFVQQLSNELAQRGHHVEVIHCTDAYRLLTTHQPPSTRYDDHPNVTVHGLQSPFGLFSPLATQQSGRPLLNSARIRDILRSSFDVIHYHNVSLVGGPKILEYGRGIKLYTTHEYWLVCPTHLLFKNNQAPCTTQQCFRCVLLHRRPPQWWRYSDLVRKSVKHIDAFIAPSKFVKEKHLEIGPRIPIVELPYFSARWQPGEAPPTGGDGGIPYFLFAGRLELVKGLQTLIPLFRRYTKARLLIAGVGSYEPALSRMAEGCENIRFLGHQSGEQLRSLYAHATAVIVPSIWYEVFGQVIIEAFSVKTPVIARNIGAMPAIIEESGGGLVYETEEQLVGVLNQMLEDPGLRRKLGLRGYQAFREKWTAEVHIKRYLDLIEAIAQSKAGALEEVL